MTTLTLGRKNLVKTSTQQAFILFSVMELMASSNGSQSLQVINLMKNAEI